MAKRTNYSNEFKFKVALEAIKGEVTFDELLLLSPLLNPSV